MTVKIKDSAKVAGVSHATVSRAWREHRASAPDTIIQTMSERRVGGIIVCCGDVTAEHGHLLQQQGTPILAVFNAPNGQLNGREASGDYFFNLPEPPTALMCFHDLMVIGLMRVIRKKYALRDNCSIVGFDNNAISAYTVPLFTTFEQTKYELGYAAARIMMNILHNEIQEDQIAKTEVLRGILVIRESTAPPKV